MTVVLALRCDDGLVLGSDSQITESDRGMSYPARKLHPLGDHAAWGGSGSRSVLKDLEVRFAAEAPAIVGAPDVGRAVQERVVPVLRHHYAMFIPEVPGEGLQGTPAAYVLAAGYARGEPFMLKVAPNGMLAHYEQVGFHAIGSGAAMAQQAGALLGHFRMAERSVDYGLLAMVRVLDALTVSQPMVGGPLNLIRLTPAGRHQVGEDELASIRDRVAQWEAGDRRVLDALFAAAPDDAEGRG